MNIIEVKNLKDGRELQPLTTMHHKALYLVENTDTYFIADVTNTASGTYLKGKEDWENAGALIETEAKALKYLNDERSIEILKKPA